MYVNDESRYILDRSEAAAERNLLYPVFNSVDTENVKRNNIGQLRYVIEQSESTLQSHVMKIFSVVPDSEFGRSCTAQMALYMSHCGPS